MASLGPNFDAEGNPIESVQPAQGFSPDGTPLESVQPQEPLIPWSPDADTLASMTAAADAEAAKERAMVPPPADIPPVRQPATIKPPEPVTATMASMGETAKKEANLTAAKQPRKHTAWMKRHGVPPPEEGQPIPGPWKAVPPVPQLDVMADMGAEARKNAGLGPKAAPVAMPPLDVERIAAPGDEQARVMQQRATEALEAIDRVFDAQNKLLEKTLLMLAAHEQKLHELDGLLERSRR